MTLHGIESGLSELGQMYTLNSDPLKDGSTGGTTYVKSHGLTFGMIDGSMPFSMDIHNIEGLGLGTSAQVGRLGKSKYHAVKAPPKERLRIY